MPKYRVRGTAIYVSAEHRNVDQVIIAEGKYEAMDEALWIDYPETCMDGHWKYGEPDIEEING